MPGSAARRRPDDFESSLEGAARTIKRPRSGRGQPLQHRHETTQTAEEYASTEAWKKASRPDCPNGCVREMQGHGSYERKTPVLFRVRRWRCPDCLVPTVSMLPDFAAAGGPGGLQQIEDELMALAACGSLLQAAKRLHPDRDELANQIRRLRVLRSRTAALLAVLATLLPELFKGCPAELGAMRDRLGTGSLLLDMRRRFDSGRLQPVPNPVGFRRPGRGGGSQTGPPTQRDN